jgi:hypothetical protein
LKLCDNSGAANGSSDTRKSRHFFAAARHFRCYIAAETVEGGIRFAAKVDPSSS